LVGFKDTSGKYAAGKTTINLLLTLFGAAEILKVLRLEIVEEY
jgi:hypothetical protein